LKYGSSGTLIWVKTWGGSSYDSASGICIDSAKNVYVYGSTSSYGSGGYDIVIVKYDLNGNKLWNTTWGLIGNDYGMDIKMGKNGFLYGSGYTDNGGNPDFDLVVIKYSPSTGTPIPPIQMWGGRNNDKPSRIAMDSNNNIYMWRN